MTDLNGDGLSELVIGNPQTDLITIFYARPAVQLTPRFHLTSSYVQSPTIPRSSSSPRDSAEYAQEITLARPLVQSANTTVWSRVGDFLLSVNTPEGHVVSPSCKLFGASYPAATRDPSQLFLPQCLKLELCYSRKFMQSHASLIFASSIFFHSLLHIHYWINLNYMFA